MTTLIENTKLYKKNLKLFDKYLINFQEDIKKIVGKFKKAFMHCLMMKFIVNVIFIY